MTRVVVTGLGLVSPLGIGCKSSWNNAMSLTPCLSSLSMDNRFEKMPVKVAGVVKNFPESAWDDAQTSAGLPRFVKFALCAAEEALIDANLLSNGEFTSDHIGRKFKPLKPYQPHEVGVCIGSGIGNLEGICSTYEKFKDKGISRVSPFFIPTILCNGAAGFVAKRFNCQGLLHSVSTACTTGLHSIGDAYNLIREGHVKAVIAGASESCIHPLTFAGFSRLKSLSSNFNDDPDNASKPFDKSRSGFVISEGAGVVILEDFDEAKKRGAHIYCEIAGYGLSSDAYHLTAPPFDASGAIACMRNAVKKLANGGSEISYINAHATSTPIGDNLEALAIKTVFQNSIKDVSVSSSKGAIGHLLGAAGSVEAALTILSMKEGIVLPTLNLNEPDDLASNLNLVMGTHEEIDFEYAMSNSFGFFGTNASMVFKKLS